MNRLSTFAFGVVVGAAGVLLLMNYHLVRASDGFHFVPKLTAKLDEPYVDIRKFTLDDWSKHQALAMAIMRNNKGDMMKDSVGTSLDGFKKSVQTSLNQVLGNR